MKQRKKVMFAKKLGEYVLVDMGQFFAAGKLIKVNPYMVTLEVPRGEQSFRPSYSLSEIRQMIPINHAEAFVLGHFSYPWTDTDVVSGHPLKRTR